MQSAKIVVMSGDTDSGSDEEWVPLVHVDDSDSDDEAPRESTGRRSTRKRKPVKYVGSATDTFFSGLPGYTHIGRTRKGGDKRPRRVTGRAQPKPSGNGSTLLNFFSMGGRPVAPLKPVAKKKPQRPISARPPITRTLGGKRPPTKQAAEAAAIVALKEKLVRSRAFGSLAKPAQKRRSWNGSVSLFCIIIIMFVNYYLYCHRYFTCCIKLIIMCLYFACLYVADEREGGTCDGVSFEGRPRGCTRHCSDICQF